MVRLGSEFEDDAVGAHAPLLEVVNDDVLLLLSTFLDADGLRAWKHWRSRNRRNLHGGRRT